MKKLKTIVVLAGMLLVSGISQAQKKPMEQAANRAPAAPDAGKMDKAPAGTSNDSFVIGPQDVLGISVWKETELSRSVPVRPDGKISLPLVGEMEASGLTPKQLETKLTEKLTAYITNPAVTVMVLEVKSQRFNIVGEVSRPGTYQISPAMTVLDAIAVAGGFRDFAKISKIYVLRAKADGTQARLPFNYKSVIKGHHPEQNIEVSARDTIVVP